MTSTLCVKQSARSGEGLDTSGPDPLPVEQDTNHERG